MNVPRDDDGIPLKSGDHFTFTFGIPPISVLCRLYRIKDDWRFDCIDPPEVKPRNGRLVELTRYYQIWKASPQRVSSARKNWSTT